MTREEYIDQQIDNGVSLEDAITAWKNLEIAKECVDGTREMPGLVSLAKVQGFARLSPEERRAMSSRAGKAAHAGGRAHEFTSEEGARAGRKGGQKVAENREHMAAIGRKGGVKTALDLEHMAKIGRKGGQKVSSDREHMRTLGKKGGNAAKSRRDAKDGAP